MKTVICGVVRSRKPQNTGEKTLRILCSRASARSKHCYRNDLRSFARAWRLETSPEAAAQHMIDLGRTSHVLLEHALREAWQYCRDMGEAKATISRRFGTVAAFLRAASIAGEAWAHEITITTRRNASDPPRNSDDR